jgi:2-C-methyl-D-erythritol 2,4-cyclodiphosphate synthase
MDERGFKIGNLDVTLILQAPKVKDIKYAMRENIAKLLRTSMDRVNVKARTHEKVKSIYLYFPVLLFL